MARARVIVEITLGSEPIAGTVCLAEATEPQPFSGWIELSTALEAARDPGGAPSPSSEDA